MSAFTLRVDDLRRRLADETDPDDLPWLGESPGRGIEEVYGLHEDLVAGPSGWSIQPYALVYDDDADMVLIVVRGPGYKRAGLAGISQEWDDLLPDGRMSYLFGALTADQVIEVMQGVVDEANRILADHAEALTEGATP